MDLDLSQEQQLLRDSVRRLCARRCDTAVVRRLEDDDDGFDREFWRGLADIGLTGMTVDPALGGSGMTTVDGAVAFLELGAAVAPSPLFGSILAADLIGAVGAPEPATGVLSGIANGGVICSIAWLEPGGGFGEDGVRVEASETGTGWRLSGRKHLVGFAGAADLLVVTARSAAGVGLFLVERGAPGLTLARQRVISSESTWAADLAEVPATLLGENGSGWAPFADALTRGLILLAAQAAGGARRALEMAVSHAATRHQFGKPLGAFQAIAHYLADARTLVDGVEPLVYEAAWAADSGRRIDRLAPMAKLAAGDAFRFVTATAQQIFGGVGFTVDYDIQLYFRRAKAWQLTWGDPRHLERLIADATFGPLGSSAAPRLSGAVA